MTEQIHSCSYCCDRPECIKAQRDELRERYDELLRKIDALEPAVEIGAHGLLWKDARFAINAPVGTKLYSLEGIKK